MRQIAEGLWVHEDSMKLAMVELPLRMTIVKLFHGELWVHSPTPISESLRREVDDLGKVVALIAPSNGHNLSLMSWVDAYPGAEVFVAQGIPGKLPELQSFRLLRQNPWPGEFNMQVMHGVPFFDECVFLHRDSRSLIVTDFVQNHRGREHTGAAKVLNKLFLEPIGFKDICLAPPLRMSFMIKDRDSLVRFVEAVLAWEFERIIVTHGDIIEQDAHSTLAALCERFTKSRRSG